MNLLLYVIATLVFSIELVFLMDYLLCLQNRHLPAVAALAWSALCFSLSFFCCRNSLILPLVLALGLACIVLIILIIYFLKMDAACRHLHYNCGETGKASLYAGKKVMLIVPHQDDDMNVASGVLEQYVRYGSEIYVVFVTNGDYWNIAQVRLTEAIRALQSIGIPEDHVIFLGYADGWAPDAPHIYNAPANAVCKSRNGYTATYALKSHPAWTEGNPYTAENLIGDMQSVILAHRPDTILCTDFDFHVEHKATTLAFEKAIGRILKQEPNYRPVVLKSFAYCTAWTALKDFPALNLLSTNDPGNQLPGTYRWADRIRFPVDGSKLSRSLLQSELYTPISLYQSQRAGIAAGAIINGDKVFWQRRTDSLLMHAQIHVSSGNGEKLNDFMLLDSDNLSDDTHQPFDGVWIPDSDDAEKTVRVTFASPVDIAELVLYDSPSPNDNILNARVSFDNGYRFDTGALNRCGSASSFPVRQNGVRSFTIELTETEGERAGLSEIEAFSQAGSGQFSYIKLMNLGGHFVYDYIIDESGTEAFQLYTFGDADSLSPQTYQVLCDHPGCSAIISEQKLFIHCPVGAACGVTVTSLANGSVSDSVFIRNPSHNDRSKMIFAQKAEEFFHRSAVYIWKQTILYRLISNIRIHIHSFLRRCKHFLLSICASGHS